jgi:hypothetical protein
MNNIVDVQEFGAVGTATSTQTRVAFENALAFALADGVREIFVPSRTESYVFDAPIVSHKVSIRGGHHGMSVMSWPTGSVPSGGHALTLTDDEEGSLWNSPNLYNLRIEGAFETGDMGGHPSAFHGIRIGEGGNTWPASKLKTVEVRGFDYGIVFDNAGGHISLEDVTAEYNYYAVYIRRGNGDNLFLNCDFANNLFAGIGMPRNTGLTLSALLRCHFGYGPYGIFQSATTADPGVGDRQQGFLNNCSFIDCSFEACGNGAIFSEATTGSDNGGAMTGNFFTGGWPAWDESDDLVRKIHTRPREYFVSTAGIAELNYVDWGYNPWPEGDLGVISYTGNGGWTLAGKPYDPPAGKVLINGDTSYNTLHPAYLKDLTITIDAGEASATHTYNAYQAGAAGAFRPMLMPRSDPGGRFWISNRDANDFTVTREGTITNAVTFEIQFQ